MKGHTLMITRIIERKAGFAAVMLVLAILASMLPGLAREFEAAKRDAAAARAEQERIVMSRTETVRDAGAED